MSSFEVCGHELKSHMVCVIFCSHVHFVGGEQVERQIKLVMFTHHVYEEGRRKGSEELPRNGYEWIMDVKLGKEEERRCNSLLGRP